MVTDNRRRIACAILLAVVIAPAAASPAAPSLLSSPEVLRFSAAVSLPGVTLAAGDYTFEVNHVDSGNVVQVRSGRTHRVVFAGFTYPMDRPRGLNAHKSVLFGEAAPGQAPPILGWFPRDRLLGYEFDYRTRR